MRGGVEMTGGYPERGLGCTRGGVEMTGGYPVGDKDVRVHLIV